MISLHLTSTLQTLLDAMGKAWVHPREKMLAILHRYSQHEISLRALRFFLLLDRIAHLPPLGGSHHTDFPTILAIQVIHHATKHDTMRRSILQARVPYYIMYHLMQQDTFRLSVCHVVIGRHRELEIIEFGLPPSSSSLKGQLSQSSLCASESQFGQRQFPAEISLVEMAKPFLHPFYRYYHKYSIFRIQGAKLGLFIENGYVFWFIMVQCIG